MQFCTPALKIQPNRPISYLPQTFTNCVNLAAWRALQPIDADPSAKEHAMPMNAIQFQPGLSLVRFEALYGTEQQ